MSDGMEELERVRADVDKLIVDVKELLDKHYWSCPEADCKVCELSIRADTM